MKSNEQVFDELSSEGAQVRLRLVKLEQFVNSPEYSELSEYHQQLIQKQWRAMDSYIRVLNSRMDDLEW
ncbi:hypothetical protein IWT25_00739 [Secundilactobacillus pentosiphilus]|uniref:Uncharacterized protein n=1 Tax=Secundilactobacillus pentosiphilus TaxID=1714682 RepID=A0A1Z5IUK8_9LACO|nr:hypothetical protein [Secundilactobacillus pentosiphilus]GAX05435.1 hypothetical protein IWT25_00739 [Secundilactobacillus pentosiphilus]